jgi:hypothetical protein
MKYGQIAAASRINGAIYRCFEFIPEDEARKFVKKFAEQPHSELQVLHTLRELPIGAFLGSQGFTVHSDPDLDGKTPDWLVEPDIVLEHVTLHAPQELQNDVRQQVEQKGIASYWGPDNADRLYERIWEKARAYKALVEHRPYVVAVFSDFLIEVDDDEINACLKGDQSLFTMYPTMSGVVLVIERGGQYSFRYFANPTAANPFTFPEGMINLHVNP